MGYLSRLFTATRQENRRAILAALPPGRGGDLLDVGAHDGAFTVRVAERVAARASYAVELIGDHAERARARGIEVLHADAEQGLPFDDGRFRTVHANQVIEHMRRTDTLLAEIRRVLEPGGLACISTNNLSSWHNVISLAAGLQPMPMHVSDELILGNPLNPERGMPHEAGRVHVRLFTARALTELCAHHGLRRVGIVSSGYYPLPTRLARLAVRIDPLHAAYVTGLFERPRRS
jgi:SAM-dependent methyltransferase